MNEFAYLHAHSEYTLTDGCLKIPEYVTKLANSDVPRAALTDTHNLFGAVKFVETAREHGVEPIVGVDLLVKTAGETGWGRKRKPDHLLVFVKDRRGYSRLSNLLSRSYRHRHEEGLHVTIEELAEQPEGLLFLGPPGPGAGEDPRQLNEERYRERLEQFHEHFGDRAGVEIPVHGTSDSLSSRIELAEENNLTPIVTHPTYYADPEDVETLNVRRAIQTNTELSELEDLPEHRRDQYFKGPDDLVETLPEGREDLPRKTLDWTDGCDFEFRTGETRLPAYPFGSSSSEELLRDRCRRNLDEKPFDASREEAEERLEHELDTIVSMGFSDYFLIVADVVNWARKNGIRVGPGRGSAAGSFVAYLMDVTTVDPFRYDLIFERFLNPDRNEMPDIDVDFADHRRERVLEYIRERFGSDHVAHIITFGRMKARNSIRDVGRVRGEPQERIDELAESVPGRSDETLASLLDRDSQIRELAESRDAEEWMRQARRTEGYVRNPSIHAAGLLITEETIDSIIPLYSDGSSDPQVASQYDMYDIEDLGFLKLDVLGLTTLTLIDRTLERTPEPDRPNLEELPEDDEKTLALFADKKLEGVFQFEAEGGRRLAQTMEPESKREVVDCIALNRPGPAQYRDDYLQRRAGDAEVEYPHPDLEEVLEDTYGLIIYQEQVMAIARIIGGFTWSESDTMRKAMGKKKTGLMEQLREKFVEGADERGYDRGFAEELFGKLAQFAEYGFNRSHSAAYGEITYQTAYLKAHFPLEFYAAFLTLKSDNRDRIKLIVSAMRDEGLELLPPDINTSGRAFRVEADAVRYGLGAVKHVGSGLADRIEEENRTDPFENLDDFLSRIPPNDLSSRSFQALAASGSLSSITDRPRGELIERADAFVERGANIYAEAQSGQSTLFGRDEGTQNEATTENWSQQRLHKAEAEALGFNLSSDSS